MVMARNGVRGVWFSLAEADAIRRMRLEVPELRLQINRLERMTEVQGERIDLYRNATDLRAEAMRLLQAQLDASLDRETRLRRQMGAWYRSPALWLTVGVLVTTAAYVAIMAGVD